MDWKDSPESKFPFNQYLYMFMWHVYFHVGRLWKPPCTPTWSSSKAECFLAGKGSTVHETLRHFCLTFCHLFALFSLAHALWIYGGASKGQDCKPDTQADAVPGALDDSFGEETSEWGLWASPCGDVDQGASGREVCSWSLGSLWSGRASPRLEADSHRIYYWLNCTHILLALAVLLSNFFPL